MRRFSLKSAPPQAPPSTLPHLRSSRAATSQHTSSASSITIAVGSGTASCLLAWNLGLGSNTRAELHVANLAFLHFALVLAFIDAYQMFNVFAVPRQAIDVVVVELREHHITFTRRRARSWRPALQRWLRPWPCLFPSIRHRAGNTRGAIADNAGARWPASATSYPAECQAPADRLRTGGRWSASARYRRS